MVTQAIPTQQMVTGADIINLGALLANMAAQTQLAFQDQAGYYNPALFGSMAGYQPTLARDQLALQERLGLAGLQLDQNRLNLDSALGFGNLDLGRDQLNAAIAQAQRQYNLDVQRFGLDVANFNYNQRLGEAQTRLQQLGLLSSLRGPSDYLAYNYVLNNMAAPPGQAVDPFQMTQGLNQQYTAPPLPNVPNPPPTHTTPMTFNNVDTSRQAASAKAQAAGKQALAQQQQKKAVPPPSPTGLAISGNPQADAALAASDAWAGAPPEIMAEFNRISQNMANTYANAKAKNPDFQLFADGGMSPGGMAIVGDQESGKPTGHEELVISPGPFVVLPNDVIKGSEMQAEHAFGGGMFGMGRQGESRGTRNGMGERIGAFPPGYFQRRQEQQPQSQPSTQPATPPQQGQPMSPQMNFMTWFQTLLQQLRGGGIPRAATGGAFAGTDPGQGFFNFNTHTPEQTANAPFIQQTLGNMASPGFQQRGQPLGPFGAQPFSYTNFLSLLPSAQQMLQGYVETPTAMGGLGGNFQDELERSRRAAATGVSLGPSVYSR